MTLRLLPHRLLLVSSLALSLPACIIELDGDLADTVQDHLDDRCVGHHARSEQRVIDEPVEAVVIDSGVGDITVRTHEQAGAVVDADRFGHDDRAEPWLQLRDGVLHVGVDCSGHGCCGADLDLTIPATARLEISLGVGDVELSGLVASADVDVGTGDIDVDHLGGPLVLHTGTGDIEGDGLLGSQAQADAGTGDVTLHYDDQADLQALTVDVGVGSVDLRVPEGSYTLDLEPGVGDVDVSGLESRADASRVIEVDVGTGSIDIRGQ